MAKENTSSCSIEVTDEAYLDMVGLPNDKLLEDMGRFLSLLQISSFLGQTYSPAYESKKPPVKCRVSYYENYGIYYEINETSGNLTILSIEDQRHNPLNCFSRYEYAVEPLPR